MTDYRRPADYQINNHYHCAQCGLKTVTASIEAAPERCYCGGYLEYDGESYPADSADWDEYRDDVNDDFQPERYR